MGETIRLPPISHEDACHLSLMFNRAAEQRLTQDQRINEWLKGLIAFAGRCSLCHGAGTINPEQASGWDETCGRCNGAGSASRSEGSR